MLIVISPGSIELKFRPPKTYKLILKNTALCSGDSFYVPGNAKYGDNKLIAPETNTCLFVWRKELNPGDVLPGFRPVYTLAMYIYEYFISIENERKNIKKKKKTKKRKLQIKNIFIYYYKIHVVITFFLN